MKSTGCDCGLAGRLRSYYEMDAVAGVTIIVDHRR